MPSPQIAQQAATPEATLPEDPPEPFGPELSVPILDPKPVVWIEDIPPVAEVPPERIQAQRFLSRADRLKPLERFSQAEEQYLAAIEADPTFAYPVYQLACNYELWGRHDDAVSQYMKAVELGFDDFPTALHDDELGRIRHRPDFQDTLRGMRERYIAASTDRVGQPVAVRPQGEKPPKGWPAMLLLHGYGDSNLNYLDFANDWAKLGFVGVAVPGSVPARGGKFIWAMDSTQPTDDNMQAIKTHDGGHHFPENWDSMQPEIATFLLADEPPA